MDTPTFKTLKHNSNTTQAFLVVTNGIILIAVTMLIF